MKSTLILLFVWIPAIFAQSTCPTAPLNPEDRRSNQNVLVIAEYNVEWLFYEYYSSSKCPGTGCPWKNQTSALQHLDRIASVIKSVDADIFLLAEVEDCNVLKMIYDRVGDSSYRYYLVKGTDTATGQNVALFTRVDPAVNLQRTEERVNWPIPGSACNTPASGSTGVSKHLYTRFNVKNLDLPLVLIGAHLIAFPDVPDRCAQREGQATVLRNLATSQGRNPNYHYVILGDLNDYDNSFLDAAGDVPISKALQIMKSDSSNNVVMMNAVSILPQSDRWSAWYDENSNCKVTPQEHTLIDHILLSPSLKPYLAEVNIFHNEYAPECNSFYSDHWPVSVLLQLNK